MTAAEPFYLTVGDAFVATPHTRGPWSDTQQHGGPPAALIARAMEAHEAAGAVDVHPVPVVRHSAWHLLGTTKMGSDPATSVVDEWCWTHDVPNLFIIDGSTMVTSTGMNPTATIMAVALRSMRHLAETRSSIPTAF